MTINQAIKILTELSKEHGDLELVGMVECDGEFIVDLDRVFDIIEIPERAGDPDGPFQRVCAFMEEVDGDGQPVLTVVQ